LAFEAQEASIADSPCDVLVLGTLVCIAAVQRLKWLLADAQQDQLSPPHLQLALAAWQSLLSNADGEQRDAANLEKRTAAESRVLDCCTGLQPSLAKRLRLSGLVDILRQQALDSVRVANFELDSQVGDHCARHPRMTASSDAAHWVVLKPCCVNQPWLSLRAQLAPSMPGLGTLTSMVCSDDNSMPLLLVICSGFVT
jgi:hypothetical protein